MNATIDDRVNLTADAATEMLPKKEFIHVYVQQTPKKIVGCEWPIEDVLAEIQKGKCSLAGPQAAKLGHGLGVESETYGNMFVETSA